MLQVQDGRMWPVCSLRRRPFVRQTAHANPHDPQSVRNAARRLRPSQARTPASQSHAAKCLRWIQAGTKLSQSSARRQFRSRAPLAKRTLKTAGGFYSSIETAGSFSIVGKVVKIAAAANNTICPTDRSLSFHPARVMALIPRTLVSMRGECDCARDGSWDCELEQALTAWQFPNLIDIISSIVSTPWPQNVFSVSSFICTHAPATLVKSRVIGDC